MVRVRVILHSYLRELLPPEAKGQAEIEFPDGSRVRDVVQKLSIPDHVVCAVNDQIERDWERALVDGDLLRFLRPGAGG